MLFISALGWNYFFSMDFFLLFQPTQRDNATKTQRLLSVKEDETTLAIGKYNKNIGFQEDRRLRLMMNLNF